MPRQRRSDVLIKGELDLAHRIAGETWAVIVSIFCDARNMPPSVRLISGTPRELLDMRAGHKPLSGKSRPGLDKYTQVTPDGCTASESYKRLTLVGCNSE
eukprot:3422445-Pyramimonas_sp.AAC.2